MSDSYIKSNYFDPNTSNMANWNRKDTVLDDLPSKSCNSLKKMPYSEKNSKKLHNFQIKNGLRLCILSRVVSLVCIMSKSSSIFETPAKKWAKIGILYRKSFSSTTASRGSSKKLFFSPDAGHVASNGLKDDSVGLGAKVRAHIWFLHLSNARHLTSATILRLNILFRER